MRTNQSHLPFPLKKDLSVDDLRDAARDIGPADFELVRRIFDEWHERLGGGTQADSIMDRIIHNAYEIPTSETNLRKIYDSKKLKRLIDEIES